VLETTINLLTSPQEQVPPRHYLKHVVLSDCALQLTSAECHNDENMTQYCACVE